MKNLLNRKQGEEIIKRNNGLLIVEKVKDGFLATDFKNSYLLSKNKEDYIAYDKERIWAKNQPWVVFEVDEDIKLPPWFNKKHYLKALEVVLKSIPSEGAIYNRMEYVIESDGYCYTPEHNGYTGGHWYANNITQCLIHCLLDWTPIFNVSLTPMELLFDNGVSVFSSKPIQIWKRDYEYFLSFFNSDERKETNVENYTNEAITLIKYATGSKNSKWRGRKRWAELLKFDGVITEFKKLSETYYPGIMNQVTEALFVARAGEYYLLRLEWGGLFGGEGDTGEEFYMFDTENELIEKINEIMEGVEK